MKRTMILSLLMLLLATAVVALPGCDSTASQRVNQLEEAVDFYVDQSRKAEADLDVLESTLKELRALKAKAENANDESVIREADKAIGYVLDRMEVVRKVKEKADRIAEQLDEEIDEVLKTGNIEVSDELELYAGTVRETSSAIPPPWNLAGYGLAGALTLAAGIFRRREKQKGNALEEVVEGTSELIKATSGVVDPTSQKNTLKMKQSSNTRKMVDDILVKKNKNK